MTVGAGPAGAGDQQAAPSQGWGGPGGPATNLILVRHGVTDSTTRKLFSGGLASSNPPLNEEGRSQVEATGQWLHPLAGHIDGLVSSPVRRTHQTAEILAGFLEHEIAVEDGIAEMEFGSWDGLTFSEVHSREPDALTAWLGNLDHPAGGHGESFRSVQQRVMAGRERLLSHWSGCTVVAVSHVTPIKTLVADALQAPLESVFRMELAPASVTVISYTGTREDPRASLRLFNARPRDLRLS